MTLVLSLAHLVASAQPAPVSRPTGPEPLPRPAAEVPVGFETEPTLERVRRPGPDRSAPPAVTPPARLPQGELESHELWPGLTAHHLRVEGVRKVSVVVVPRCGTLCLFDPDVGVGRATGWLMDAATAGRDSTALEILTDVNDIQLHSGLDLHDGQFGLLVPKEKLNLGLELLGEMIREPAFAKEDLKNYQREMRVFYEAQGIADLGTLASYALSHAWYPADHPYGARYDLDAVLRLKGADLTEAHQVLRESAPIDVVVVGDVGWDRVEPLLRTALEGWGKPGQPDPDRPFTPPSTQSILAVDLPGNPQAALRLRLAAPPRGHADDVPFRVVNWALGGHFLSRLNANLREDKGYTYGSRSSLFQSSTRGAVTLSVDVKAENVAGAMAEIEVELARLAAEGLTEAEAQAAQRAQISWWNEIRKTADTASSAYVQALRKGRTLADEGADIDAMVAVDPARSQTVAAQWLGKDAPRQWVVVGDRQSLEATLAAVGLPVTWIDAEAALYGTF